MTFQGHKVITHVTILLTDVIYLYSMLAVSNTVKFPNPENLGRVHELGTCHIQVEL